MKESLRENGEKKATSLARTSLSTSHEITTSHDYRNRILLNRSWGFVTCETDVGEQVLIEGRIGELVNGLRNILSRSLDGNVIVVGEVDSGMHLGRIVGNTKKFSLQACICGTWDVFAIPPLAITRATGDGSPSPAAV